MIQSKSPVQMNREVEMPKLKESAISKRNLLQDK